MLLVTLDNMCLCTSGMLNMGGWILLNSRTCYNMHDYYLQQLEKTGYDNSLYANYWGLWLTYKVRQPIATHLVVHWGCCNLLKQMVCNCLQWVIINNYKFNYWLDTSRVHNLVSAHLPSCSIKSWLEKILQCYHASVTTALAVSYT